jgi:hypothetical protein
MSDIKHGRDEIQPRGNQSHSENQLRKDGEALKAQMKTQIHSLTSWMDVNQAKLIMKR